MNEKSFKRDQVVEIISSVVRRVSNVYPVDNGLITEVEQLKNAIDHMRDNLSGAHPEHIQSHIPATTDELDAIVTTTEEATNNIMSACEAIQHLVKDKPLEESAQIESEIIRIIEACTFQDLTGQRITKIIKALKEIDRHASELSRILKERFADLENKVDEPAKDELLNGPQLPGRGISQDEINDLLNSF